MRWTRAQHTASAHGGVDSFFTHPAKLWHHRSPRNDTPPDLSTVPPEVGGGNLRLMLHRLPLESVSSALSTDDSGVLGAGASGLSTRLPWSIIKTNILRPETVFLFSLSPAFYFFIYFFISDCWVRLVDFSRGSYRELYSTDFLKRELSWAVLSEPSRGAFSRLPSVKYLSSNLLSLHLARGNREIRSRLWLRFQDSSVEEPREGKNVTLTCQYDRAIAPLVDEASVEDTPARTLTS